MRFALEVVCGAKIKKKVDPELEQTHLTNKLLPTERENERHKTFEISGSKEQR